MDDLDRAAMRRVRRMAQRLIEEPEDVYDAVIRTMVLAIGSIDDACLEMLFFETLDLVYGSERPQQPVGALTRNYAPILGDLAAPTTHMVFAAVMGLAGLRPREWVEALVRRNIGAFREVSGG